jgi:hypothetical protein
MSTYTVALDEEDLARLDEIPEECKVPGLPGDRTRLCNKWTHAKAKDKEDLRKLIIDEYEAGKHLTTEKWAATNLQQKKKQFRIYEKKCLQNNIDNYRKAILKEAGEKKQSKIICLPPKLSFIFF